MDGQCQDRNRADINATLAMLGGQFSEGFNREGACATDLRPHLKYNLHGEEHG